MATQAKTQTDLEKKRTNKRMTVAEKGSSIKDFLMSPDSQAKIQQLAPVFLKPESVVRVALTAMQKNSKLLECTEGSLLQALIDCASYGLVPSSTTNEAHLIPFGDQCVLVVGYKGLIKLATNTGLVSHVEVSKVYKNDEFYIEKGTEKKMRHIPAVSNPGDYIGSYAVVVFTSGHKDWEYVSKELGMEHAKRFAKGLHKKDRSGNKTSPWLTDQPSMDAKTAVRMALKYVPASPQSAKLTEAIARDELQETRGPIDVTWNEPEKDEIPPPESKTEQEAKKKEEEEKKKKEEQEKGKVPSNVDPDTGEIIPDNVLSGESAPPPPDGTLFGKEKDQKPAG